MADVKISALPAATTPVAGTEVLPIVQSSTTKKVAISDLTAGRTMSAAALTLTTTPLGVASGGTGLTSLTAGYIPYGNGTGAFGNSSSLFWDSANSRLGIGTSSPVLKLDVAGASSQMRIYSSTDTNPVYTQYRVGSSIAYVGMDGSGGSTFGSAYGLVMWNSASAPILFSTSDTERMRITSGGLVGVGTSSPITAFNLSGGTSAVYQTFTNTSGSYQHFYIGNPSNALTFGQSNLNGSFSANELMRLDAAGNLGLGVTPRTWSTGKAFSVGFTGSSVWSATTSGNIFVLSNAYFDGGYKYDVSSKPASYYQQNDGIHTWHTAPSGTAGNAISFTQAMTLTASGDLLVGTTSSAGVLTLSNTGASTCRVQLNGTTNYSVFQAKNTSGDFYFGIDNSTGSGFSAGAYGRVLYSSGAYPIVFTTDSAERARIDASGNIGIKNSTSVPAANFSGGGYLYVEGGALKYRGSSGTVTTIANA